MTEVELNGELIGEYLDQRELYGIATMIRRRQDEEAQGPEPRTYLGMQVAAPVDRAGQRPMVTGADLSVLPGQHGATTQRAKNRRSDSALTNCQPWEGPVNRCAVLKFPTRFRVVKRVMPMANNDNEQPVADSRAVLKALDSLRRLEAPAERVKWRVAEQRWLYAIAAINVVLENPASTRAQVAEATEYLCGWG
jgi:hypothetical protein